MGRSQLIGTAVLVLTAFAPVARADDLPKEETTDPPVVPPPVAPAPVVEPVDHVTINGGFCRSTTPTTCSTRPIATRSATSARATRCSASASTRSARASSRSAPYIGTPTAVAFTTGEPDGEWHSMFNVNLGFYFTTHPLEGAR